uniref:Uncharacterized protein n=1 Tax=Talaromyces marneffei PM1 TaxID=1077442 RepID=A0A093W2M0_TALMA
MTQPFLTPQGRSTTCKDQATEQTSKKLRSACDRCHSAKVRCSAEGAPPEGLLESRHIRRILSLSRSEKASNSSSNSSSSSNNNNNAIFSPAVVVDKGPQTTSVFPSSTGLGSPNNDRDQDQDQDLCNGASASFIEPPPRTPLSQTYSLLDMEHVDALNEEIPGIVGTPGWVATHIILRVAIDWKPSIRSQPSAQAFQLTINPISITSRAPIAAPHRLICLRD